MGYGFLGRGVARSALAVREREEAYVAGAAGVAASALDPDVLHDLADEIALLAAQLSAGKYPMLRRIARFDRLRGWEPGGHRSCSHWLSFRTGYGLGTARELVRVALALEDLPLTRAALARGALPYCKARAVTRAARPESEEELLELARGCTTGDLERVIRAWKRGTRKDEAEWEQERHASRCFSVFPDDDGMYAVSGRLDPEVGALLMRVLEAAGDALYRRRGPVSDDLSERDRVREAARRRADAIGLVAERALAAGFGASEPEAEGTGPIEAADPARAGEAPISGTRAERYQVLLHVEPEALTANGEGELSELEDGTRVSYETARRLACDAGLVRVTHDAQDHSVLDVGRRSRTIPPALRRALEVRDRGCRFPGCGLRFTDAHHVVHWADGGATSLGNTLLLCRYHHRLVHEEGWSAEWWGHGDAGRARSVAFRDPRGSLHVGQPPAPPALTGLTPETDADQIGGPIAALMAHSDLAGTGPPDAMTACARWNCEADIPDSVLLPVLETL